jgi:hypothetical protein
VFFSSKVWKQLPIPILVAANSGSTLSVFETDIIVLKIYQEPCRTGFWATRKRGQ